MGIMKYVLVHPIGTAVAYCSRTGWEPSVDSIATLGCVPVRTRSSLSARPLRGTWVSSLVLCIDFLLEDHNESEATSEVPWCAAPESAGAGLDSMVPRRAYRCGVAR